jgi:hypothetical protein
VLIRKRTEEFEEKRRIQRKPTSPWDMQKIFLIVRPTEDSTWFEYQAATKILARKPFVEVC